jgi:hypothetical protein
MDKKTYSIGILSVIAVVLLIGNLLTTRATADVAVTSENVQAVTATTSKGGDALYLYDVSSGKLAVFTVAPREGLQLVTVENLEEAFAADGGGRRGAKNGKAGKRDD